MSGFDRHKFPFLSQMPTQPDKVMMWTVPFDSRFPTVNQTRHCWLNYIQYNQCINLLPDDQKGQCNKSLAYFTTLCPFEWVEKWDELKEEDRLPGQMAWKYPLKIMEAAENQ